MKMEIGKNLTVAVGYMCATLVSLMFFLMLIWLATPSEFEIKINITADDNLVKIANLTDRIQERQYEYKEDCLDHEYWWNNGEGLTPENVNQTKLDEAMKCLQRRKMVVKK